MLSRAGWIAIKLREAWLYLAHFSDPSNPTRAGLDAVWARLMLMDEQVQSASSPEDRLLSKRAKAMADWRALVQQWAKARSKQLRDQASVQVHQKEVALKDKLRGIRRGKAVAQQLQDLAARTDRFLANAVHAQSSVGLTDFAPSVVRSEGDLACERESSDVLMDVVQGAFAELTKAMARVKASNEDGDVLRVAGSCPHVVTAYRDGLDFWASAIGRCGDKIEACVQAREELEQLIADLQHIDLGLCREEKSAWAAIRMVRKPFLEAAYRELPVDWLKAAGIRSPYNEETERIKQTPALVE